MGCKSSSQKYADKLILKSMNKVDIGLIETIIINTLFHEKDIYYLYKKFLKLEPNPNGLISNTQLMELPEFKYCPFKSHLPRVFKLEKNPLQPKEDENSNSNVSEEDSGEAEDSKNGSDRDKSPNANLKVNNKSDQNNNFIRSVDSKFFSNYFFRKFC
jgi:hypothetical protein